MINRAHVIDPVCHRRAQIAREFSARGIHTEIYEDLAEFAQRCPANGFVFAADDEHNCSSAEVIQSMRSNGRSLPVVMYGEQPTPERIVRSMLCGALDYLEWPFNAKLLNSAFRRLSTDGVRKIQRDRLRSDASNRIGRLSPRERDVLHELVLGLSNKKIAEVLQISPRTVEIHRGNMMRKLNAQSAADAVRVALYAGLDEDFQYAA